MSASVEFSSDPCRAGSTFSVPRFLAFALLFIAMLGVGGVLLIWLSDTPYGIQLGSGVSYTAAVILYGFAKNRNGIQPYLFTCPVVVSQYPRLLKRHAAFLAMVVGFETASLQIKPHLSPWWLTANGRNDPPFAVALAIGCGIFAIVEIVTNRSVLERAHAELFGAAASQIAAEDSMSILGSKY
ncbi:MAG: hypothetical protein ACLGSD_18405 [Acidobacteriota bacterium]